MAQGQRGVMELGGNLPESLIEHLMLASPKAGDRFAETEPADDLEMNFDDESKPFETNDVEEKEEDDDDVEEPLKAAGR